MRNIRYGRWLAVVAAVIILAPGLADARAGAGSSSGSRGSQTGRAPPPTQTAPTTQPIERSARPQDPAPPVATPSAARSGGFFSRNPFLSGLMGGMLGAGLFGMLFGGGFSGGLGGFAGMFGLLLQFLLIGGLVYLGVRLFRARTAARAPAYAYSAPTTGMSSGSAPLGGAGGLLPPASASPHLLITETDYNAFEGLLTDIQAAYGAGALAKLRELATPEMVGYFSEELSANASRGVENKVEAVKLEQGDLSEAWSEAGLDYATVAMRFSLIDVTRRIADGRIVEGSDRDRTQATEVWTFVRSSRGGKWILSAIQQT